MEVQGLTLVSGRSKADFSINADEVKEKRPVSSDSQYSDKEAESSGAANSIQPEELIKNIKALTEEGVYSVRFEVDDATHDLVINLINQESGEVIRQVPSEEILGTRKFLADLRGNLVETDCQRSFFGSRFC